MSFAVFGPMPETLRNGGVVVVGDGLRDLLGTVSATSTPSADFGPTPVTPISSVEDLELVLRLRSRRATATSSRTISSCGSTRSSPTRSSSACCGVTLTA